MSNDCDGECDCWERVDELEERLGSLQEDYYNTLEQYFRPQITSLREENAALRSEVNQLESICDDAQTERAELAADVSSVIEDIHKTVGVKEEQTSTRRKRAYDTRAILVRRAESKSGVGAGRAQATYRDVLDILADQGHGSFTAPIGYTVLDDLEGEEGFERATNGEGNRVIRVNTNDLPEGVVEAFNQVNNATADQPPGERLNTVAER